MKAAEIREVKSADLRVQLDQLRRHLFDLRAQAVTEKLENPRQLGATKREIARIQTILRQRNE